MKCSDIRWLSWPSATQAPSTPTARHVANPQYVLPGRPTARARDWNSRHSEQSLFSLSECPVPERAMSYDSIPTPMERPTKDHRGESRSIEWYSEGQTRIVEVGNVRIEIRFVGRRG